MADLRLRLAGCVALLFTVPALSQADPISFLFNVHVSEGIGTLPRPFTPVSFSLIATFENTPRQVDQGSDYRAEYYGHATFSPIPLYTPSPYEGRPLQGLSSQTGTQWFESLEGFAHYAQVANGYEQPNGFFLGGRDYEQEIRIEGFAVGLTSPPDLNPHSLAERAGTPRDEFNHEFNLFLHFAKFSTEDPDFVLELAEYQGYATFAGQVAMPQPVPEPGTLLLFITGASALGRSAWKRRHNRSQIVQ
jgi:hypothetical protein